MDKEWVSPVLEEDFDYSFMEGSEGSPEIMEVQDLVDVSPPKINDLVEVYEVDEIPTFDIEDEILREEEEDLE